MVEGFPSMLETFGFIPNPRKKERERERQEGREGGREREEKKRKVVIPTLEEKFSRHK
jgi:hypothetical protein